MKVALIGATGDAGTRIMTELFSRGHHVTAIARNIGGLAPSRQLTVRQADANRPEVLAEALRGHDAVICAVKYSGADPESLIQAARNCGVTRFIAVGGAGSLRDPRGHLVIDDPKFPPQVLPEATKNAEFFKLLRDSRDLDWTYISPSLFFQAGVRTGRYLRGKDELLMNGPRPASISFEDFAVALVDELESPRHIRERFTVADAV